MPRSEEHGEGAHVTEWGAGRGKLWLQLRSGREASWRAPFKRLIAVIGVAHLKGTLDTQS